MIQIAVVAVSVESRNSPSAVTTMPMIGISLYLPVCDTIWPDPIDEIEQRAHHRDHEQSGLASRRRR